jgi:hypothetical protein
MDRFNALGRGTQIMLVAGVLLLISLFLPWQDFGVGDVGEFSGWEGLLGVLLGLLTIALVAWIALRVFAPQVRLPVSQALAAALLGGLIVLIAILKLLSIIDDEATFWAYLGFILAILVGVGAWMVIQDAGGIATLKSEIPSTPETFQSQGAPPASTPPPAAPTPPPAASTPPAPEAAPHAGEPAPPVEPAAPPEQRPPAEPEAPYDPDARRDG